MTDRIPNLALAYVAIDATDLDAWCGFAGQLLGFQVERRGDDEVLGRMDARRQRLLIRRADRDGLAAFGLEARSVADLDRLRFRLGEAGHASVTGDRDVTEDREVQSLVHVSDPSGIPIELVVGHRVTSEPFVSPSGARFVSDGDVGMGHVVLHVTELDASVAFYTGPLGFGVSDTMTLGPASLAFLHCNERHHTIAVMESGAEPGLHHFMVEVDSIDTVGRGYDRVLAAGLPLEFTLGRHTNDEMVSFYVRSPSGFSVEYGTGGRRVTPGSWTAGHFDAPSTWGHAMPPGVR